MLTKHFLEFLDTRADNVAAALETLYTTAKDNEAKRNKHWYTRMYYDLVYIEDAITFDIEAVKILQEKIEAMRNKAVYHAKMGYHTIHLKAEDLSFFEDSFYKYCIINKLPY